MKFYRLEKTNYFKIWTKAILKSLGIALVISVALLVVCGYKFMIVSSGSMEPTLPVGSLVIVTPCEYEDLKLGDIVTMEGSGINLTHRIVGKKIEGTNEIVEPDDPRYESAIWYTKGDANNEADGPIKKNIVGTVSESHVFKFVGVIVRYVKANFVMLIVLAVIMVAFVEVLNWLKSKLETEDVECYEMEDDE